MQKVNLRGGCVKSIQKPSELLIFCLFVLNYKVKLIIRITLKGNSKIIKYFM